jgi:hypothetical protein
MSKPVPTTIAAQWSEYESQVLPPCAGETQRRETRIAFYCGALALYQITDVIGQAETSEEAGMVILDVIHGEMVAFTAELRRAAGCCGNVPALSGAADEEVAP